MLVRGRLLVGIGLMTTVISSSLARTIEWPLWEVVDGVPTLEFSDGEMIALDAVAFSSIRGPGATDVDPAIPGLGADLPPTAFVSTGAGHPTTVQAHRRIFTLDLTHKTILPETTFGLADLGGDLFNYYMTLVDSNNNPLSMANVRAEQIDMTYDNGIPGDLNIELDRVTGSLPLGTVHSKGSTYDQGGLVLLTNLPAQTSAINLYAQHDQNTQGIHVIAGEGTLGPEVPAEDGVFTPPTPRSSRR
jgi:hypothetical protein